MELNEFLLKFKEQYVDASSIELSNDSDFRAVESYDSLTGMAILVMIQDEFGVSISEEQYKALPSVRELYNYIQSQLA